MKPSSPQEIVDYDPRPDYSIRVELDNIQQEKDSLDQKVQGIKDSVTKVRTGIRNFTSVTSKDESKFNKHVLKLRTYSNSMLSSLLINKEQSDQIENALKSIEAALK